jgi:alcohol dehydrogenase class IV
VLESTPSAERRIARMWYFVSPKIVFGEGALNALSELEGRRALIVTDQNMVRFGIVERVQAHLKRAGLASTVFDSVEPDPDVDAVRQGALRAAEFEPDWIIGLGGGSSIDAAKAVWILYERPDLEPAAINPFVTLGLRRKARMVAIPTTSGTGSEATWATVLTDPREGRKMAVGTRECLPDIAIVDPALAAGMPPQLTADSGLDALTHAVEGYTCTWHTDITDGLCVHAARLIIEYLPRAYRDGADEEARERLHNAATCAGLGFGNAMAAIAHAMGHATGAVFHVPHGRAVSVFLPYTIEFAARELPERYAEMARLVGCSDETGLAGALSLARRIRELCRAIDSPHSLSDAGIDRTEFGGNLDKLVDDAANDTSIVAAPRVPTYDELERLFLYAYEGRSVDF